MTTMASVKFKSTSLETFREIIQRMACLVQKECRVIFLSGSLGAGKTECARVWLRAAGVEGRIKSPSFSVIESYENTKYGRIHHIDLYRMNGSDDLRCLGIEEYLEDRLIIEWPEKGCGIIAKNDLEIKITQDNESRVIQCTSQYKEIMSKLRSMQLNNHEK